MEILKPYRDKIDALDVEIAELLRQRFDVVRNVAAVKARNDIPAVLETRIREVIDNAAARGGRSEDQIREIYTLIVTIACDLEEKLMAGYTETI